MATSTDLAYLFVFRDSVRASLYRLSTFGKEAKDLTILNSRTSGIVYADQLADAFFASPTEDFSADRFIVS